jgi:hypothetical protein
MQMELEGIMRAWLAIVAFMVLNGCTHGRYGGRMLPMDGDRDGKVTKAEWDQHFTELDSDKNGEVSSEEFRLHKQHMHGKCAEMKACECEHCQQKAGECKCAKDGKPCPCASENGKKRNCPHCDD